jgi:hypothetical protein
LENIFYLGFNTNPKNGRVKALSKACLDRTYYTGGFLQCKNQAIHTSPSNRGSSIAALWTAAQVFLSLPQIFITEILF